MGFWGADVEGLRQTATVFDNESATVQQVIQTVGSALNSVEWVGPDADNFRAEWDGTFVPQLNACSELLAAGAQSLRADADQQEAASTS